jgi:hypothetical protein
MNNGRVIIPVDCSGDLARDEELICATSGVWEGCRRSGLRDDFYNRRKRAVCADVQLKAVRKKMRWFVLQRAPT